jgi:hypothetical protein
MLRRGFMGLCSGLVLGVVFATGGVFGGVGGSVVDRRRELEDRWLRGPRLRLPSAGHDWFVEALGRYEGGEVEFIEALRVSYGSS